MLMSNDNKNIYLYIFIFSEYFSLQVLIAHFRTILSSKLNIFFKKVNQNNSVKIHICSYFQFLLFTYMVNLFLRLVHLCLYGDDKDRDGMRSRVLI